jgi:hypothetical protein
MVNLITIFLVLLAPLAWLLVGVGGDAEQN